MIMEKIFTSHHCRHCGDKRVLIRPSLKRWNKIKLLDVIRALVLAEAKKLITVEDYASHLKAKKKLVDQCFAILNRENLLSQAINHSPHDSTRNPWGGNDSAWSATMYVVLKNK